MKQVAVINIVGLSTALLQHKELFLSKWLEKNGGIHSVSPVFPALTCTVQSTYLTGKWPSEHGIVGNGWYFKEEAEVKFWKQSNQLVQAPKIWDLAKELNPDFTCANMFWWYNMYSNADFSVTPRPQYRADGQKKPDCYSQPASLRDRLQERLGIFPLFDFWGPKTSIKSSKWIAEATKLVQEWHNPTLTLVYLPHLDYCCQKFDPAAPEVLKDLKEIDEVCKDLILFFEAKGIQPILLSEYGITAVHQPIHLNRILRNQGYLAIREENGLELLDAGVSAAFAVADHQIAHIYLNDPSLKGAVKSLLEQLPGVEKVLDEAGKKEYHIDHERAGELICIADKDSWFTYYYWLDDQKAPDFARMVDIHKKPGYDPAEMLLDPHKQLMIPRIVAKLLKKKLGFRTVMDFIGLDATVVKGSHGRVDVAAADQPVLIGAGIKGTNLKGTEVCPIILEAIFGATVKEDQDSTAVLEKIVLIN
ncbi:alkaline phosphatase family protein [Pedobacter gandavensis]|uniref:alkaline phosphatase family protein n=1 Tax=Pedobacter gandavensis TaxID=2679963 RepID=UPI0024797BB4|nr:nucleotide pyrophosphatase/phosphodiesterase family protein [Pedobacter gandavensis]WGQ11326.1 alkaline phosphatase family protein [Pedobacter gandavensis]